MTFVDRLIQPVSELLGKVLDKVVGDKMSQAEKAVLKMQAEQMAAVMLQEQENSFRAFVLEYEGSAKDMPMFVQVLRNLVRPSITFVAFGGLCWICFFIATNPSVPEHMARVLDIGYKVNLLVLLFWFGDKFVQRTGLLQVLGSVVGSGKNDNAGG